MVGGDEVVIKKTIGEKIFTVINIILLIILCITCLYPMLHVLFSSISDPIELMKHQGIMFRPLGFTINGYKLVL